MDFGATCKSKLAGESSFRKSLTLTLSLAGHKLFHTARAKAPGREFTLDANNKRRMCGHSGCAVAADARTSTRYPFGERS